MEPIGSKIVKMLNAEYFGATHVSIYMKRLIVQVEPALPAVQLERIKSVIAFLIEEHFPSRIEDLSFLLKRPAHSDVFFTVYKPQRFTNLNGSAPLKDPDCASTIVSC